MTKDTSASLLQDTGIRRLSRGRLADGLRRPPPAPPISYPRCRGIRIKIADPARRLHTAQVRNMRILCLTHSTHSTRSRVVPVAKLPTTVGWRDAEPLCVFSRDRCPTRNIRARDSDGIETKLTMSRVVAAGSHGSGWLGLAGTA